MLRFLVLLLFLANLVFYVWTQGWLDSLTGLPAEGGREPQRLTRQVHPDAIRILPSPAGASEPASAPSPTSPAASSTAVPSASAASSSGTPSRPPSSATGPSSALDALSGADAAGRAASASASVAGSTASGAASPLAGAVPLPGAVCLEAGPFSSDERQVAEQALRGVLPAGDWQERTVLRSGLWMVYMGPFATPDALAAKERELRDIGVDFAPVRQPSVYAGGLSLGRFEQRANAEQALGRLSTRFGVRTARIVTVRAPQAQSMLRVPQADARIRTALGGLGAALAGKRFQPCTDDATTL